MPGTRIFFLGCLLVAVGILGFGLGDSFRAGDSVPPQVAAGHAVWREYGCEQCHSIYGQGGAYAPDLTRIVEQRGTTYISEFMVNPAAYHPEQRIMPRFTISQQETRDVIEFLAWVAGDESRIVNFPPNPIQVAGSGGLLPPALSPSTGTTSNTPADTAITGGQRIFSQRCASCHSLEQGVTIVGPTLWGIADTAWYRIPGQSPQEYIRNSVVNPGEYLVEGYENVMQKNLGELLSSEDLENLVAFLMTFEDTGSDAGFAPTN